MIQEAKPKNFRKELTKDEYKLENYDLEWENMLETESGRGLMTYIKCGVKCKPYDPGVKFEEYQAFTIDVNKNEKLLAINMYHSPNSNDDNSTILNDLIMKVAAENVFNFVLIVGDGNFKLIDWSSMSCLSSETSKSFKFLETVKDAFFTQHITQPTRGRGTDIPSTLDLIITKSDDIIEDIAIEAPLGKSDHAMISARLTCNFEQIPIKKVRWQYDQGNYNKLMEMLPDDWNEILEGKSVNEMWIIFKKKLDDAIKECIPRKTIIINGKVRRSKKVDRRTLKKIKRKKRVWDLYIQSGDGQKYLEYCRLRNQVRAATRKLQKQLEKSVASEAKSNPKKFWQFVNNKMKTRPTIPDLLLEDEDDEPDNQSDKEPEYTKNDQEKANRFNTFFALVFNKHSEEQEQTLPMRTNNKMMNIEITQDRVEKALRALKINKSPGPDGLHPRLLKEVSTSIIPALTLIYQTSIQTGTLPDDWLLADISPIYKKGKRHVAGNYRPVSLTCICCKILETIVREQVMEHLKSNKLISAKQFGFMSGRSTTLQLLTILDKWTSILDRGGSIDVIYFDFMKAFDKVSHGRLLMKLRLYGIDGNLHKWIKAFLSGRKQRVTVNGASSNWEDVTSGVPQGSVLGPLLFILFINDMPEVVDQNSLLVLFADDAKLSREIKEPEDKDIEQEDIDRLHEWSIENESCFHPDKCHVLRIGEREMDLRDLFDSYKLGEKTLNTVHEERDLGVVIDQDLTFEKHMLEKIKKANQKVGLIRRSFMHMDKEMFLMLYKSLIRPQLEYANQVWAPRLQKHKTMLENVQRRATKLVPGLEDLSYEERLRELKLPTLAYRRLRGDLIEVFKIMSGKCDSVVCEGLIVRREGERSSGHPLKIFKERPRQDMRKNGFPHRVVDIWNKRRMGSVVGAATVKEFERRLDLVMAGQDIIYNYTAETKNLKLKYIVFDKDAELNTIREEEDETEDPEL